MLGNVNFFAGSLTSSQIKKYDTDGDGKLSNDELAAAQKDSEANAPKADTKTGELPLDYTYGVMISSYSQEADTQAEAVETPAEARKSFNTSKESFIETYIKQIQQNGALDSNEKKSLIAFINTKSAAFIDQYLKKNAKGPYNMSEITSAYQKNIEQLLAQRAEKNEAAKAKMKNYKENTDSNFDALSKYTQEASADYMTEDEYSQIKGLAVDYIMGELLNGTDISAFLSGINSNYKNNQEYRVAMTFINSIQTETDPDKIESCLQFAVQHLEAFIGAKAQDGTSKLTNAVDAKNRQVINEKAASEIDKFIDKDLEAFSHTKDGVTKQERSQEAVDRRAKWLENIKTAFLAQYTGDGTDLEKAFAEFQTKIEKEAQEVMNDMDKHYDNQYTGAKQTEGKYEDIKNTVQNAGTYVTKEEKTQIDSAVVENIVAGLLNGETENSMLAYICPDYKTSGKYQLAKQLLEGCLTSATPKKDYEKAKALLAELTSTVSAATIRNYVNLEESKNVNIKPNDVSYGLWGYHSNDTVGGDDDVYTQFKVTDGRVEWTNGEDAADINKTFSQLSQRIHEKLKTQLGSLYNADEINKYIDQATVEMAMGLSNVDGLHDISELVDSFLAKFNTIATNGLKKQGSSESASTLDKSAVLSSADAYGDYASGIHSGSWHKGKKNTAMQEARNEANSYLDKLTSAIIEQYKAKLGDKFDETAITKMINDVKAGLVNNDNTYIDTNSHHNGYKWGFNTQSLYNSYFSKLDEAFANYLKQTGTTL